MDTSYNFPDLFRRIWKDAFSNLFSFISSLIIIWVLEESRAPEITRKSIFLLMEGVYFCASS